jgi:hypothetical protein
MALNPLKDWKKFRYPRPITMVSVRSSNLPSVAFEIPTAFRGVCKYSQPTPNNGAFVRPEATYLIPKDVDNPNGVGPWKPGDLLTDELELDPTSVNNFEPNQIDATPTTYTVLVAENDEFYWFLYVFNPTIAYNLRNEMDIYNIEYDKDAAGAGVAVAQDLVYDGIKCRLQWSSGMPTIENNRSGVQHEATIYSSQRLYLKENYLIEIMDTSQETLWRFDVIEWVNPDRIDELMAIRVRVTP